MKFTFFLNGPFSQWYRCQFKISGLEFNCAEQFMMYSKAILFRDFVSAKAILEAKTPREQKLLGRKIQNFDEDQWKIFREGIVFTGNYAKFCQNPKLKEQLIGTKGTLLVEASPKDLIWGIGFKADDPRANDPMQWRGQNLLGNVLTRVRCVIDSEFNMCLND